MSNPGLFVTGVIVNSSSKEGEDPFVDFQTSPPDDGDKGTRHYFEAVAATTEVNLNLYQFEPTALIMLAEDFKRNKTLTINHRHGFYDST